MIKILSVPLDFNHLQFVKSPTWDKQTATKYVCRSRCVVAAVFFFFFVGGWGGGGGWTLLPLYGIVRMCVPNSPLFQRCQVYEWPLVFNKKYMNDPIFLDSYVKGPIFSDILVYAHIFRSVIFPCCLFSWYSMKLTVIVV